MSAGAPTPASSPQRTLVLGGARSGKSELAERMVRAEPCLTYVATGPAVTAGDHEWTARVREHRERRPAHWTTWETTDVAAALRDAPGPLLIDSLTAWLNAVLDSAGAWRDEPGWRARVGAQVDELLAAWQGAQVRVVAVSDEVGCGVVPATASGRLFRDLLGELNTAVARASQRVLLVVAGHTLDLSPAEPGGAP